VPAAFLGSPETEEFAMTFRVVTLSLCILSPHTVEEHFHSTLRRRLLTWAKSFTGIAR